MDATFGVFDGPFDSRKKEIARCLLRQSPFRTPPMEFSSPPPPFFALSSGT